MTLLISNKPILHLCSHVNAICTKLAQLDKQIQTHCLYFHSQTDLVQINAPEYDSDIDGQTDTLPDIQPQVPSHAENTEEDSSPVTVSSKEFPMLPQDSDRFESQSKSAQNPAEIHYIRTLSNSGNNTKIAKDPN